MHGLKQIKCMGIACDGPSGFAEIDDNDSLLYTMISELAHVG